MPTQRIRSFLALAAGLLLSTTAPAAEFFADPARGTATGTGSAEQPWPSLEAALATRRTWHAGDVLILHGGYHGRPTITGVIAGGVVTIRAAAGQQPVVGNLAFKGATRWDVSGLRITPEGTPAPKRKPAALVTIAADCREIRLHGCELYSVASIHGWTEADWKNLAVDGITSAGTQCTLEGNRLRNVRFGIGISRPGRNSRILRNRIEDFMSDGLRGLADDCLFEGNVVQNCYAIDGNHDDGFQSWSGGTDGERVGSSVVRGVVLRGNTFISYTDPAQPFKAAMQGIGCFDGMYEDWVIENNVVVTDMWHGIALYGARNCRIVNNTVMKNPINAADRTPWIQISPHKHGEPSVGNVIRNNLTPTLNLTTGAGTADHNLVGADPAALFVDAAKFDFHLRAGSPAIDAGSNELAPATDLAGTPRARPADLGAYEFTGPRAP